MCTICRMSTALSRVVDQSSRTRLIISSVDRTRRSDVNLRYGLSVERSNVISTFDRYSVPDGTPFVADFDGQLDRVRSLNAYLLEAARQRAYSRDTLLNKHARPLVGLLEHVRVRDSTADLVDATREDLVGYRDKRVILLTPGSWNNELSAISNFFHYAMARGWIDTDPIPRWGAAGRVTIRDRTTHTRRVKFLTEAQARRFLDFGLRGDGSPREEFPAYPERDYALGLTFVSTGLRRVEAALLLDAEIPSEVESNGVHTFWRIGKGERHREVWITDVLADVVHSYRRKERWPLVEKAQPRLRRARRDGKLILAEKLVTSANGQVRVVIGGTAHSLDHISDAVRANLAVVREDGIIEPLALFLVEGGRPPALRTINSLFNDASARVLARGHHPDTPPAHLDVTPHVMRHTFAVRTLAALIRHGRIEANDPYALLSSPLLVVQELMGHGDLATTLRYLHLAERYSDQVPDALRFAAAALARRV